MAVMGLSLAGWAQDTVRLSMGRGSQQEWVVDSQGPGTWVQVLERSTDFASWQEVGLTHGDWVQFPLSPSDGTAFYRIRARPSVAEDDWKNQVKIPGDPLMATGGGEGVGGMRWVKFILRLDEPGRVYYQDSTRYLFHHTFAAARLRGYEGISAEAFDALSLTPQGQELVLGAVVLPADPGVAEVGLQLVGRRPFPVSEVSSWLKWVRRSLVLPAGWRVYYLPSFEQGEGSAEDAAWLASKGFPISTPARWVQGDECYSPGWAFGPLRYVPAGDLGQAYASGRLRHDDILLTDAVPAEIPMVAGTLSLSPATPNSHVSILAQSLGLPFAYVAGAETGDRLRAWDGKEVVVVAERFADRSTVRVVPVDGLLTESQRQQLLEAREPARWEVVPMASRGLVHVPVLDLTAADLRYVGGKAAHFGVLARAIPDETPFPAIAFTFDLWNGFMDRLQSDGMSLRQRIAERWAGHAFPPDMARWLGDLEAIRGWIRREADFAPEQKAAILEALKPFEEGRRIRFRSSTNVEDSEQFSGAGLYDSYSGCLGDDLDGDEVGPSRCDPMEDGERGIFRALRRVFASFYNDQAALERLRHGVKESEVGMAVLVHSSFPDETELANGVVTLQVRRGENPEVLTYQGEMVSQSGAVSVSNPEGNARPEVVSVNRGVEGSPLFEVRRRSSLVPLGGTVMGWPQDYAELFQKLHLSTVEFAKGVPERGEFVLDFEYKKVQPGRLVVKQVREVPVMGSVQAPPPFTLQDAGRLVVFQHHGKDLFANHRLKSIWHFQSLVFEGSAGETGYDFFTDLQRHDGAVLRRMEDRMGSLSNAVITVSGTRLEYRWTWAEGPLRGAYRMAATFDRTLDASRRVHLGDALDIEISATYAEPQAGLDAEGRPRKVTSEKTRLVPLDSIVDGTLERRAVVRQGSVTIEVDYTLGFLKWGVPGIGIFDGKSFPLVRWGGTTLRGLTRAPIQLRGEFSQTYDSIRHNFMETFLFEPGLEPGLDPGLLEELRAKDIRRIQLEYPASFPEIEPRIRVWGWDDRIRDWE